MLAGSPRPPYCLARLSAIRFTRKSSRSKLPEVVSHTSALITSTKRGIAPHATPFPHFCLYLWTFQKRYLLSTFPREDAGRPSCNTRGALFQTAMDQQVDHRQHK